MQYEILNFDSEIFGFKVAKILPKKLELASLKAILHDLTVQQVRLVYWQVDGGCKESNQAAAQLHGFLACKQVTYYLKLTKNHLPAQAHYIFSYQDKVPTKDMEDLAIKIGEKSRFGQDPRIPRDGFYRMYHLWIKNSVNHSVASEVLVAGANKIIGMITLRNKNGRGDIGLLAVDDQHRGQGIASALLTAAKHYFINHGYQDLQVVTQQSNFSACALYEKNGFSCEQIDSFYHFWL